jgi:DNA replication protein DnaC
MKKDIERAALTVKRVPAICESCGKEFDRPVFTLFEKEVFRVRECPKCAAPREEQARITDNQAREDAVWKPLRLVVPPRYRNFDRNLLPIGDKTIDRILNWRPKPPVDAGNSARILPVRQLQMTDETIERVRNSRPSPSADGRGLLVEGPPHIGKRRLIYELAANLYFERFQIWAISSPDFESLAPLRTDRDTGGAVRRKIAQIRSVQILILTDVGGEKLTETAQREFYGLVEHRAQHLLPILWTTQFSQKQVAARFKTDNAPEVALARGHAAVQRLNEISDVIHVERESFDIAIRTAPEARSA